MKGNIGEMVSCIKLNSQMYLACLFRLECLLLPSVATLKECVDECEEYKMRKRSKEIMCCCEISVCLCVLQRELVVHWSVHFDVCIHQNELFMGGRKKATQNICI